MNPDLDYYSIDEIADNEMLRKLQFTKRRMIALIHMGFLDATYNSTEGVWLTTKDEVRYLLELRNQAIERRIVDAGEYG